MKSIKAILNQTVDLLFGLSALCLLIWYFLDQSKNFTGFLGLVVGYVSFNIINKVQLIIKSERDPKQEDSDA
jgi:hypothetical protein